MVCISSDTEWMYYDNNLKNLYTEIVKFWLDPVDKKNTRLTISKKFWRLQKLNLMISFIGCNTKTGFAIKRTFSAEKKFLITDRVVSTKHSILTMSATAAKEILNTAANFKLKRGRKRILILRKGDGKLCREREAREGDLVREGGREWKRSGKRVER